MDVLSIIRMGGFRRLAILLYLCIGDDSHQSSPKKDELRCILASVFFYFIEYWLMNLFLFTICEKRSIKKQTELQNLELQKRNFRRMFKQVLCGSGMTQRITKMCFVIRMCQNSCVSRHTSMFFIRNNLIYIHNMMNQFSQ